MPSAPWPAAGHMISAGIICLTSSRLAEALQSGRGEDDGVVFSLLEFAQAGVDVAAQRMNVEVGADGFELRLAAQAGGADARALRQFLKARIVARAEGVARVLAFGDGGDFESWGQFGGQVFQASARRDRRVRRRGLLRFLW